MNKNISGGVNAAKGFMANGLNAGIKNNVKKDINELFFDRIIKHKEYYNNNELLKSIYCYFKKIIENNYMI